MADMRFILTYLFLASSIAFSNDYLDSLKNVANNTSLNDSLRFSALNELSTDVSIHEMDSVFVYVNKMMSLAIQKNDKKSQVDALYNGATAYLMVQEFEKAGEEFRKCAELASRYEFKEKEGYSYLNLAGTLSQQGNFLKAIKYHIKCREVFLESGDTVGYAGSFLNEGIIHAERKNYKSSIDCFNESKTIFKSVKHDRGYSLSILNLGAVYSYQDLDDSALVYFNKSLELSMASGDIAGQALCLMNIGSIYDNMELLGKSFDAMNKSLLLYEQLGPLAGSNKILLQCNLANYYSKKGNYKKALDYSYLSYDNAIKMESQILIRQIAKNHYRILLESGHFEESIEILERYVELNDSIQDEEMSQKILHEKYTLEAKQDSLSFVKEKELSDLRYEKEISTDKRLLEQEELKRTYLFIGIGILILLGSMILIGYSRKRKDNITINEKNTELEDQKIVLENKNKEVHDSIVYAKRIQSTILPSYKEFKTNLKESFVIYKPKDIVAGDFYWMEKVDEKILFAAADCTGHGVPGAIVSVFCNSCLNQSVREYKLTDPSEILNKTRELLILEFEKSNEDVKDGMDIALCVLDGDSLEYSGANNSLWLFRNNELIELKGDRQPIGKYSDAKPYTIHKVELEKGDTIYMPTDGFADQFGGGKGKKFRVKSLKNLLMKIQHEPLSSQKLIIEKVFEDWMGDLEQLDDVCILGYRH